MKEITVSNVCKAYDGRPVLQNVSFTAREDRPTCLRAPSGTGKTTLLRLLLGLDEVPKPDDTADALACAICHANHKMHNYGR